MSARSGPPYLRPALALIAIVVAGALPGRAAKAVSPGGFCAVPVQAAEARYEIPKGLLFAIGQVESGQPDAQHQGLVPWPWTVQAQNQSYYFPDKASAVRWVQVAEARGITAIDVGCLQIDLMYHPQAFKTLDDAFDPVANANYAARFLASLYAQTGDWQLAAGRYHSQTLALAIPYRERVADALAGRPWTGKPVAAPKPTVLSLLQAAWGATLEAPADGTPPAPTEGWNVPLPQPPHRARRPASEPVLLSDAH